MEPTKKPTMDNVELFIKKMGIEDPDWYQEGQYDAILLYHPNDREKAHILKGEIESLECKPRICTEDDSCLYYQGLKRREECFNKSTYMMMYITQNFVGFHSDLIKEDAVAEMFDNPDKRWCLLPMICLDTMKDVNLPFGLRGIKPIEIKAIPSKSCPSDTTYFEKFQKRNLVKIMNLKKQYKREREKKDEHELKLWKIEKFKEQMAISHQRKAETDAAASMNLTKKLSELSLKEQKNKREEGMSQTSRSRDKGCTDILPGTVINIYHAKGVQLGNSNTMTVTTYDDDDSTSSEEEEFDDATEERAVYKNDATGRKTVYDNDATEGKTVDKNDETERKTVDKNDETERKTVDKNDATERKTVDKNDETERKTVCKNDATERKTVYENDETVCKTPFRADDVYSDLTLQGGIVKCLFETC